ncbi:MAG TPA: homoserine dehydrogenase [Hyphomicrobium sp.]|nr:homoserine dehydrogenase [Hyphomicrobium sp.]
MKEPLKIGIAGLGTVGGGLLELLATHGGWLGDIAGRPIEVTGVAAKSRAEQKGPVAEKAKWFPDAVALAKDPSNSVFVELIGGDSGIAKACVEAALDAGKHVVTANKALLAKHGVDLARRAEKAGVSLNFEAAVAGGIPIIKTLREALGANEVTRVYGILNGTCNYILTKMQSEKLPFADVLKEAQAKGYAEADPTFDIGGFDTAHKLALLTSLAFSTRVALDEIHVEGIENVTAEDIEAADSLGYRIKLLGVAAQTEKGILARVSPCLVYKDSAIAEVSGVTNAVAIDADFSGTILLVGAGAGGRATASAVASDILDIARGTTLPPFVLPTSALRAHKAAPLDAHYGSYYVRLSLEDKPGMMAAIATRMGDRGISLESIVQHRPVAPHVPGATPVPASKAPVSVIIITHETTEEAMRKALETIVADGKVTQRPQVIRIEEL